MRKHHALATRLLDRENDYLRWTTDPTVPFDNNEAEVRHEVAVRREALEIEGGARPPRWAVAAVRWELGAG